MDWADQFGDPQLSTLIDEALAGDPTIDQARARIEKASSFVGTANSALYPNVTGSYSWTRERYSANSIVPPPFGGTWQSENTVLASASWDLDLWGKNRERLRQAISQEKVADAEAEEVRISLAASVASTYNNLAQLYALRDIEVREVKNREEITQITHGRVGAGLDTNVEQQTANGETATSRSSVSDLDGQITTVRYQLGALHGKGPWLEDRAAIAWRHCRVRVAGQPARRPHLTPAGHRGGLLAGGCSHPRCEGGEGRVLSGRQSFCSCGTRRVRLRTVPDGW
jgi:outer membrane protein TolC